MRRVIVTGCLLALAACSPSAKTSPSPAPSASAAASDNPANVVLHVYNADLAGGGEPGMQVVVHANGQLAVTLHGTDGSVEVCAITGIGKEPGACSSPANGAPLTVDSTGVEVRERSGSRTLDEIAVAYSPFSRRVDVRSGTISPRPGESACKDSCNPFYEMTPYAAGTLGATATWDGIGTGRLLIQAGGVAARAYSKLGRPYTVVSESTGSSDNGPRILQVSTTRDQAQEVAVVLENQGARSLLAPTLHISWP